MVSARPINPNVSCKLNPYSFQRKRSPTGSHLPKMIGNTHPRNYYNLKSKDIDVHFFKLRNYIVNWITIDLASLVSDVYHWVGGTVSAVHSVVAGAISSGVNHGINCWCDLIRSKHLPRVSVYRVQVFAVFSGHGNSVHYIIPLLKKEECTNPVQSACH